MYKDTVPNDVHNPSIQSSSDVNNDIVNDMMKVSDMKKIDEFNNINGGMYNGKQ